MTLARINRIAVFCVLLTGALFAQTFDPETGEPIIPKEEESLEFDQETRELIPEKPDTLLFDPETGLPVTGQKEIKTETQPQPEIQIPIQQRALFENSTPLEAQEKADEVKYWVFYVGPNIGSLTEFRAESAFKSGPRPGQPLWEATVPETKSVASVPRIGMRLGVWKKYFGGDIDINLLNHYTPAQTVFYDTEGYIYLAEEDVYYPVSPDSVTLPDRFLKMLSFGFGGNVYLLGPSFDRVQPYVGLGASLLMNQVTSDYPGPGSFALGLEGENLNSTSMGWALEFPIGIRIKAWETTFMFLEFRAARHFFSFVSSDAFQKENDDVTLQTFNIILGIGKISP
ncbi:MAG TPA: hypothetical protein EYM55_00200 [Candidatus Marinimicrobia bacterium]|nr:hypothetical protein [Candidatus Neomarinimicrobiota bacterium]